MKYFNGVLAFVIVLGFFAYVLSSRSDNESVVPMSQLTTNDPATSKPSFNQPARRGSLKLDRAWADEYNDWGHVLISYDNDSGQTLPGSVQIRCNAFGKNGDKVGTGWDKFWVSDHGPIVAGFKGTLEVLIRLNGASMSKAECLIESVQ